MTVRDQAEAIDAYLDAAPEPHRAALRAIRQELRALLPEAIEMISYGMPAFKIAVRPGRLKGVAAYAAFKKHCSIFPMSGTVIPALAADLAGYATSKAGVQFSPEAGFPPALLARIVAFRLAEINAGR